MREVREAEDFLAALAMANKRNERRYWVAVRKNSGKAVGTLGLILGDNPEFGYGFAPEAWGTGLFQEAARAVLAFGCAELDLHRISVITRADNVRAIRAVEKIGFITDCVLPKYYNWNGTLKDGIRLVLDV